MIPILSQLPSQYSTVILLGLIIVTLIIAFRIMKMVFETLSITFISGIFYLALVYLFNYSFSLNHMLFYAFLGASLYLSFKFLTSAYQIAETAVSIPYKAIKILFIPIKKLYSVLEDQISGEKVRKIKEKAPRKDKGSSGKSSNSNTKEVVLDKVMDQDSEE